MATLWADFLLATILVLGVAIPLWEGWKQHRQSDLAKQGRVLDVWGRVEQRPERAAIRLYLLQVNQIYRRSSARVRWQYAALLVPVVAGVALLVLRILG